MSGKHLRPGPGPWAAVVSVLAFATGPAGAAPVAGSAAATSLAMPGEFLEAEYLLHQHPQLGVLVPGHLAVTNAVSFGSPGSLRGSFRSGNGAFLVLSQPFIIQPVGLSSTLFHAGLATRGGPVRLGAAIRGTAGRNDDVRIDDYLEDDLNDRTFLDESRGTYLEGAVGTGIGGSERFLDLTFEAYRETYENRTFESDPPDTLDVDIDSRPRVQFGGVARAGVPGPLGSRVQLVGSFRDRTTRVDLERVESDSLPTHRRRKNYGHSWRAGLAVTREVRDAALTFHALYGNDSGPTEYDTTSSLLVVDERRLERESVRFGLAMRRPFWWETTLHVGFQNEFVLQKDAFFRETTDSRIDVDERTGEFLRQAFGWGLRRSFDNLDLTGSLQTNLPAGDLFAALDAVFRL